MRRTPLFRFVRVNRRCRNKAIASPDLFIHAMPHMSFVHGAANVAFLKKRRAALTAHQLYKGMSTPRMIKVLELCFAAQLNGRW
jgi:L-2-hydroxyglutarate oxidase LhgO